MSNSGLIQTFMQIRPALIRFLSARGASPSMAEDILQDISLRLSSTTIGPISEPSAYLYKMVSNGFLLHRRGEARRAQREKDWVDAQGTGTSAIDPDATAEERLIHREQLAILRAALERLPERTRTIFLRARVSGERQKQIAADLGISVKAVEKHLARAYEEIAATKLILDGDKPLPRHLMGQGA